MGPGSVRKRALGRDDEGREYALAIITLPAAA
ncbi:hypothetical protein ACVIGB_003641 [Bradyrhizobium sp. USDA 4341]